MRASLAAACLLSVIGSVSFAGGSANGDRLAVITYWGDDTVALLDTQGETGKEEVWAIDVLKAVGCSKPYDVRVNAAGSKAYVTCSGDDKIIGIDIVAQMVEWTLKTGRSPRDLQLFNNDDRLVVANSGSDTVSVVDIPSRKVVYDVAAPLQPYGVAIGPGGRTAYVTGWASADLHIISLGATAGRNLGTVKVGLLPYTVVAPQQGTTAYVAANGAHSVFAVDTSGRRVIGRQAVGRNPWSIATNPSGQLLVANNRSSSLSFLRGGSGTRGAAPFSTPTTIQAGSVTRQGAATPRAPKNVALSADGRTGLFTDLANNQVVVVDTSTGRIKRAINVGKAPYGLEFIR